MSLNKRILLIGITILALALAACAGAAQPTPSATQPPASQPGLGNTSWTLESFGPKGAEAPVLDGYPITLTFENETQAVGSGGCNSYGGHYIAQGGALSFSQVISTERACLDQAAMQQETAYYTALNAAGSFQLTGDSLTIEYNDGQSVLNFVKQAAS